MFIGITLVLNIEYKEKCFLSVNFLFFVQRNKKLLLFFNAHYFRLFPAAVIYWSWPSILLMLNSSKRSTRSALLSKREGADVGLCFSLQSPKIVFMTLRDYV